MGVLRIVLLLGTVLTWPMCYCVVRLVFGTNSSYRAAASIVFPIFFTFHLLGSRLVSSSHRVSSSSGLSSSPGRFLL